MLCFVRTYPGEDGDVGNRVLRAGDKRAGALQLGVENTVEPVHFLAVAFNGVRHRLGGIQQEVAVLSGHRSESSHLPHQPLNDLSSTAHVCLLYTSDAADE